VRERDRIDLPPPRVGVARKGDREQNTAKENDAPQHDTLEGRCEMMVRRKSGIKATAVHNPAFPMSCRVAPY
jgi:hypothetical protein